MSRPHLVSNPSTAHQLLKHSARRLFRTFGLDLRRWRPETDECTLAGTFQRLVEHGIPFDTVIDVGASNGSWSEQLQKFFPGKSHLLIEANPIREGTLSLLCKRNADWDYVIKAAGGRTGNLFFDDTDPQGGHLSETQITSNYKPFPVTTIDAEVERLKLKGPFLIKLDTHGVEVPILNGAENALTECEVLIIECYNFPTERPCLPFWEMCCWMSDKGFLPLDVHDVCYRQYDHSFWQLDFLFARKTRPEFAYRKYR